LIRLLAGEDGPANETETNINIFRYKKHLCLKKVEVRVIIALNYQKQKKSNCAEILQSVLKIKHKYY